MEPSAAIFGCEGLELSEDERAFFRGVRPFGFILFARNCKSPDQIRALTLALRSCVERQNAPIFIDQEGGRVARLGPPHWKKRPPVRRIGELFERDPDKGRAAAYLHARLIANDLWALGVNADCAPVLDIPVPGAHDIIGDRAYAPRPGPVIELGRAAIEGFLDGGVLPVIKHIPGHGRAMADSHLELPRVGASADELSLQDFLPFRALNHAPIAMTAHVVYEAFDEKRPATVSPRVVGRVIRGEIGFERFLISDDLSMAALSGSLAYRAKASLFAGCDAVLHCNGKMDEMREVATRAKELSGKALERANEALAALRKPSPLDIGAAEAHLDEMIGVSV
jgi:beta-N-acetylhexosaminidase